MGGIAAFKQQNAVHGLPLQLSPEEVTYLMKEVGVIRLYSIKDFADRIREPLSKDTQDSEEKEWSESASDAEDEGEEWQRALAHGTEFVIPTEEPEMEERMWDVAWTYPQTQEETQQYVIFVDLKKKKYTITAGSKFGADYLLYPGDPTQFHAQFCVRIKNIDDRVVPASLAAACRGSFQARKHLLYASVDADQRVLYTTFGQIGGFG